MSLSLFRISHRLASSLISDLLNGHVYGHHEAVFGPYCRVKNFTLAKLDQNKTGSILFGHTKSVNRETAHQFDVEAFNPLPGTLIHPVKCEAYVSKSMQSAIEKWTVPYEAVGLPSNWSSLRYQPKW